jgi:hypothetical protein
MPDSGNRILPRSDRDDLATGRRTFFLIRINHEMPCE